MSNKNGRKKQLPQWVEKAKEAGFPVTGGRNASGYINLARCCELPHSDKAEAKYALRKLLGAYKSKPYLPATAPAKTIYWEDRCEQSVADDTFLSTYEWRKLRMEALKLYGAKCQCCGASASTGAVINVDHIKPRRKYPELALDLNNLQILCSPCNHGKGNWDETDWRSAEGSEPEQKAHMQEIAHP